MKTHKISDSPTGAMPESVPPEKSAEAAAPDLRGELQVHLEEQFEAHLKSEGTLPGAICESLSGLLNGGIPTAADVLRALASTAGNKTEVANE